MIAFGQSPSSTFSSSILPLEQLQGRQMSSLVLVHAARRSQHGKPVYLPLGCPNGWVELLLRRAGPLTLPPWSDISWDATQSSGLAQLAGCTCLVFTKSCIWSPAPYKPGVAMLASNLNTQRVEEDQKFKVSLDYSVSLGLSQNTKWEKERDRQTKWEKGEGEGRKKAVK